MDKTLQLNQNALVAYLQKPQSEFRRDDIIRYIEETGVRMVNFMYPAEDGRLKTLNFAIGNRAYLETFLTEGERVDGSSLFPSFVDASGSDLYVVPRYRTAFLDPFAEIPTVGMLCSFFDRNGQPFDGAPAETLRRAAEAFRHNTGMEFEAMGELEYYVIDANDEAFPATEQRGYHESAPFAKFSSFRQHCMDYIARLGGEIKYGHSEVGTFYREGDIYEQNEIEFLPCPVESAADQLLLAKWAIRNLAWEYGLNVTFAPKIIVGEAGSGLHIHMRMTRDGQNQLLDADGKLSPIARRAIAGVLQYAPALTAFGNKNPTSYFRLVPHQEAPTNVCWGDSNRSALVRVPLGWTTGRDLCAAANPLEPVSNRNTQQKQTFELRSADCSADVYQLMAGLCVAARKGLEMPEADALRIAEEKYVSVNIHAAENAERLAQLDTLPTCCAESADRLEEVRQAFEAEGVFRPKMIDGVLRALRAHNDRNLHAEADKDPQLMQRLVDQYFHCG
ncbi:MAG: glutamine synthetase [Alloprevotella sp.]|nr:glutamine synthetase [Alloprevotella sp.]